MKTAAKDARGPSRGRQDRSVARLAAVQALYQMETAGAGAEAVVREFRDHRFGGDIEGAPLAEADEAFFGDIVRGVVERQAEIDRLVTARLAQGWKLARLDATTRALLRAGVWELLAADVPTEVVIDEYVELTKAFHEAASESGFVNGALDAVAREVRA